MGGETKRISRDTGETAQKKEIYADRESTDEEERRERRMKG